MNLESNWRLIHYYSANKKERGTFTEEWFPRYFENKFSIKCPGKYSKKFCVYLQNFLGLQQSFTRSVIRLICRSFFKVVHRSMAYFVKRKVSQQIHINDKKHAMKYITIKYYLFATDKKTIQEKTISFSVPFVWMNLTKGSLCESKN